MVNVSKKYINKELQAKAWSIFLQEIGGAGSPEVLLSRLRKFFTPSEIIMLEKRLSISVLVQQKVSYKSICRILDVSHTTVSFVKHNLTKPQTVRKKRSVYEKPRRTKSFLPRYKGTSPLF